MGIKNLFGFLTVILKKYRERKIIKMVKNDWESFRGLSDKEQTDAVIDAAMDVNIRAFEWIKNKKKMTYKRRLKAVRGYWWMLQFIPENKQTDSIIKAALKNSPRAFRCIKDENKLTYEMCLNGVRDDFIFIQFVPDKWEERVKRERFKRS